MYLVHFEEMYSIIYLTQSIKGLKYWFAQYELLIDLSVGSPVFIFGAQ